jgi:hypothetical protein
MGGSLFILGARADFASAMLYSLSAMTAYGHANVFLAKQWQLMGAMEALNGMLLFGLSTGSCSRFFATTGRPDRSDSGPAHKSTRNK